MSLSECLGLFDKGSWDLLELYTAVFIHFEKRKWVSGFL